MCCRTTLPAIMHLRYLVSRCKPSAKICLMSIQVSCLVTDRHSIRPFSARPALQFAISLPTSHHRSFKTAPADYTTAPPPPRHGNYQATLKYFDLELGTKVAVAGSSVESVGFWSFFFLRSISWFMRS